MALWDLKLAVPGLISVAMEDMILEWQSFQIKYV
jgi:hypothetical protein